MRKLFPAVAAVILLLSACASPQNTDLQEPPSASQPSETLSKVTATQPAPTLIPTPAPTATPSMNMEAYAAAYGKAEFDYPTPDPNIDHPIILADQALDFKMPPRFVDGIYTEFDSLPAEWVSLHPVSLKRTIEENTLHLSIKNLQNSWQFLYNTQARVLDSVSIMEAKVLNPEAGGNIGMICRWKDYNNLTVVYAGADHMVYAFANVKGQWVPLGEAQSNFYSLPDFNRYQLSCIGDELKFFVNERLVLEAKNEQSQEGFNGVMVATCCYTDTYDAWIKSFESRSPMVPPETAAQTEQPALSSPEPAHTPDTSLRLAADFKTGSPLWQTLENETGTVKLLDDGLELAVKKPYTYLVSFIDQAPAENIGLQASIERLEGLSYNLSGVVCRAKDEKNFYGFGINNAGTVKIIKVKDGQLTELYSEDYLYAHGIDPLENTLSAECSGTNLMFWLNDKLIWNDGDTEFKAGRYGVFALSYQYAPLTVKVKQFEVWEPNQY